LFLWFPKRFHYLQYDHQLILSLNRISKSTLSTAKNIDNNNMQNNYCIWVEMRFATIALWVEEIADEYEFLDFAGIMRQIGTTAAKKQQPGTTMRGTRPW
jgi:hypothetical protein